MTSQDSAVSRAANETSGAPTPGSDGPVGDRGRSSAAAAVNAPVVMRAGGNRADITGLVGGAVRGGGSPNTAPPGQRDEFAEYLEAAMRDPDFRGAYLDAGRRRDLLVELIEVRRALGLTQTFVAEAMGTTQSAVSELEGGADDPRVSTLQRYARAVGKRLVVEIAEREEVSSPAQRLYGAGFDADTATALASHGYDVLGYCDLSSGSVAVWGQQK